MRQRLSDTCSAAKAEARFLNASTSDLKGRASSTGVRAWRKFCAQFGYRALRPLDAMAPLGVKLREERLVMRFIMCIFIEHFVTMAFTFGLNRCRG